MKDLGRRTASTIETVVFDDYGTLNVSFNDLMYSYQAGNVVLFSFLTEEGSSLGVLTDLYTDNGVYYVTFLAGGYVVLCTAEDPYAKMEVDNLITWQDAYDIGGGGGGGNVLVLSMDMENMELHGASPDEIIDTMENGGVVAINGVMDGAYATQMTQLELQVQGESGFAELSIGEGFVMYWNAKVEVWQTSPPEDEGGGPYE